MIRKSALSSHLGGPIRLFILLFCATAIASMLSLPAVAAVTEISISPENPSPGDTITVTGKASPNEVVTASVSFEQVQKVSGGTFSYSLSSLTIPKDSDSFGFTASGVDNLRIEAKVPLLGYVSVPGNFISFNGNTATFGTGKISSGTYDIRLSGSSGESEVNLAFIARATITADEDGNFVYTYNTDNIPEGDYRVKLGGKSLQVNLGDTQEGSQPSSSSGSKKSSNTGTELKIVEANTSGNGFGDADSLEPSESGSKNAVQDTYVEGFELSPKPSGIMDSLPGSGVMGAIVGIMSLGVIYAGYRRNRYK